MTTYLFLNQMAGPVFRELAEDLSAGSAGNILLTGHPDTLSMAPPDGLEFHRAPEYDRRGIVRRLWSWVRYFCRAFRVVAAEDRKRILFIVSNPPFLGAVGLFFKVLRRQRYVMLVYDIYPDLLVALGRLKPGCLTWIWRRMNCLVYERAEVVFTVSEAMATNLKIHFDPGTTAAGKIVVIPNWADVERIKPLPKGQNSFAAKLGLTNGTTTVLYSGNMGLSHDLETLVEAAERMAWENDLRFLFIGNGAQEERIKRAAEKYPATITWLPFQPEEVLPKAMAAGDIGIVSGQEGTEGLMVPSKTYYYLAAGLAPIFIGFKDPDSICGFDLGGHIRNGDIGGLVALISHWHRNRPELERIKKLARRTARERFSRKRNTEVYRQSLRHFIGSNK